LPSRIETDPCRCLGEQANQPATGPIETAGSASGERALVSEHQSAPPTGAHEPIFNVPAVVTALAALMIGVHVIRQLVSEQTDNWIVAATAFIPARYSGFANEIPGGEPAMAWSYITHMFLHGDGMHLMFNLAWLLAFGGALAKRIGSVRFLLFAALCGICGALLFQILNPGLPAPVVGASGAISGMMAAVLRYLFSALDDGGIRQLRDNPKSVQMMSLWQTLTDRRIVLATAVWLLMNIGAVYGVGTGGASGPIAWEAHIGGFVFGLLCFGWFDLAHAKSDTSQPSLD
jgi:membrane associated rhomboid family serine protease